MAETVPIPLAPSDALASLCERFHVRRLDLFGSAAGGRFDPARSDLDFLVEFEEPTGMSYFNAYFGLREALADLFSREVDLVTEASIENPFFRRMVETQRRHLFHAP